MKYFVISLVLISSLYADLITKKTLACPSVEALRNAPVDAMDDPMALSMFSIANDCEILSRRSSVEALGYDPMNADDKFVQIIYLHNGKTLYVNRAAINIEQAGKRNGLRF